MIKITKENHPSLFAFCKLLPKLKNESNSNFSIFSNFLHIDEHYIKWTNCHALLRADIELIKSFHEKFGENEEIKTGFYKPVKEDSKTFILIAQDVSQKFPDTDCIIKDVTSLDKITEYEMTEETIAAIVTAVFSNIDKKSVVLIDKNYTKLVVDLQLPEIRLSKSNVPILFIDENITLVVMPKCFGDFKYNNQDYSKII